MINYQFLMEARRKSDPGPWNYLVGGACDEITLRRNRLAFQEWSFVPLALQDVSQINTSTSFLGFESKFPIIASPIGGLTQYHPSGEVEWAHGLKAAGAMGALSGVSRMEPEKVIRESGADLFFQLYFFGDDSWIRAQVKAAETNGYRAIVITTDTAYFGQRERDILLNYDARSTAPRFTPPPPDRSRNTKLSWNNIKKIASYTKLPLILKGAFVVSDIDIAKRAGVKALWISNHGGRQLDHLPASLTLLKELAPACHKKGLPVIFDGGVRRGSEAAMAMLLGADLVAVGRLPIYGLIVDGRKGVQKVFEQLHLEFVETLGLLGLSSVRELRAKSSSRLTRNSASPLLTKWELLENDQLLKAP